MDQRWTDPAWIFDGGQSYDSYLLIVLMETWCFWYTLLLVVFGVLFLVLIMLLMLFVSFIFMMGMGQIVRTHSSYSFFPWTSETIQFLEYTMTWHIQTSQFCWQKNLVLLMISWLHHITSQFLSIPSDGSVSHLDSLCRKLAIELNIIWVYPKMGLVGSDQNPTVYQWFPVKCVVCEFPNH